MNYKQLQKLNEIIENLKAPPNSDENIQFVLDLADKSVKIKTLEFLIQNGNSVAMPSKLQEDEQANFGLKFTNEEIRQMPKTFKKEFLIDSSLANCAFVKAENKHKPMNYAIAGTAIIYLLAVKPKKKSKKILSKS